MMIKILTVPLVFCLIISLAEKFCHSDPEIPFNVDLKFTVQLPQDDLSLDIRNRNRHYPSLFGASVMVFSEQSMHKY